MSGDASPADPPRIGDRRLRITPAIELGVLALAVAVAVGSYFVVRGGSAPQRLLTPPLVALLLIVNLAPCVALIMLFGRRIARRRAITSSGGSQGSLHVRLVALFSVIATVPTVLAVLFAAVMFQYGVQFWLSGRVSGLLQNATTLAQESYEATLTRWNREVVTAAGDIASHFGDLKKTSDSAVLLKERDSEFGMSLPQYVGNQLYYRNLNEGAIFSIKNGSIAEFIARFDPHGDVARQIDPIALSSLLKGESSIVTVSNNRIKILTMIPGSKGIFLYAGVINDASLIDRQAKQMQRVFSDFKALQARARALQLQFNAALFVVALLIVGIAVWIALVVADRLVRPVGEMVAAARRVAEGDLSARVPDPRTDDEVGMLANAFNTMTGRLEEQTGALESRRALIEAVMSGVSAGVVSVSGDGAIRLINASAAELLKIDEPKAVGAPLSNIAPELADLLSGDVREAVVQLTAGGESRTLAVRLTADEDGRVLTFDDITQQLLDQRRAAWSDVARRIAHEIKNPLTPIQLAAERLQRRYGKTIDEKDGVFAQLTDTIVRQVGDLRRMVDEFSSFARMPKPVFHQESLIDLSRQALFLHEVAHPAIRFALHAPDAVPLICDRRQIGQAMTNVVKNAVEAIEARGEGLAGEINVTLRRETPDAYHLTVEIADDGIGLPVERDRIVEPYMTTRSRGTGLGLAIVKKIIEEHCGTIAFGDRPGGGTIVTIVFDTAALESMLDDADVANDSNPGDGGLAILTRTGRKP
ncbi:sensor histidine kinase NtrY-like [Sphingomonas sp.]|jgi:two-component system nitrogen regulation sensor histidine kinase NtrY|uniref:sensor histidine kinase NtrY-like n=1 Tax=Sphingomonas sp. TaxID=28214 RepID=UPI002E3113B6|nr:ATP-binding protein [Sphingomonas sp.]HEX4693752.1 ATP-binding protein [Sphingomonas sp.]